jgi:hypothetical protein
VPMTNAVRAALQHSRRGALSPHVIEWRGQARRVGQGLAAAARRAGLPMSRRTCSATVPPSTWRRPPFQ